MFGVKCSDVKNAELLQSLNCVHMFLFSFRQEPTVKC